VRQIFLKIGINNFLSMYKPWLSMLYLNLIFIITLGVLLLSNCASTNQNSTSNGNQKVIDTIDIFRYGTGYVKGEKQRKERLYREVANLDLGRTYLEMRNFIVEDSVYEKYGYGYVKGSSAPDELAYGLALGRLSMPVIKEMQSYGVDIFKYLLPESSPQGRALISPVIVEVEALTQLVEDRSPDDELDASVEVRVINVLKGNKIVAAGSTIVIRDNAYSPMPEHLRDNYKVLSPKKGERYLLCISYEQYRNYVVANKKPIPSKTYYVCSLWLPLSLIGREITEHDKSLATSILELCNRLQNVFNKL
jgi:hypothetical protein